MVRCRDRVPLNVAKLAEFGYIQLIQDEASSILPDLIYEVNRVAGSVVLEEDQKMTTIAISQSNYLPWKGYFQLISKVDVFVFYDTVDFTKRDWRSRNKILVLMDFNG